MNISGMDCRRSRCLSPGVYSPGDIDSKRCWGGVEWVRCGRPWTQSSNTAPVAIKMIPPELCRDVRVVGILKKEATTALEVSHENIVRLLNFEETGGEAFLVMEYVDGRNLAEILHEKGSFSPAEVENLALQVCRGLKWAHAKGVVHRDLKPANIMLTLAGQGQTGRFRESPRAMKDTLTRFTGKSAGTTGTLPYMAPEQVRGKAVGPEADVYALGSDHVRVAHRRTPVPQRETSPTRLFTRTRNLSTKRRRL